ncbi:MAG TPA: radical SAM protein [Anaerolineae bacterium]|nr:radical SAM protein [Anaerolineae bacterium]
MSAQAGNSLSSILVARYLRHPRRLWAVCQYASCDIRRNLLGQTLPLRPTTLNLLVNDVCNSRCQMCNIWQRKRDKELTPDELARILGDPLFSRLRYVGVSGGEPTLRRDLPEIYKVLVQRQPRLVGTGIITNAIRAEEVLSRILASAQVCRDAGVPFNVMVSLDGPGAIHDRVRGRPGNFESAVSVLRHLRDQTDIPLSIGCTITKDNLRHVDEVLDFARAEGVYARFRVAEFILRLYNSDRTETIRNFTDLEAYHLGLFMAKLEYTYEPSQAIRRTYRNLRRMLMEGSKRSIGCLWQTSAVTLDCRGQLLYCSPKSPVLGNCLEDSAQELYRSNIDTRRAIIVDHCPDCLHDYHADPTVGELWERVRHRWWRQRLSLDTALQAARSQALPKSHAQVGAAPRQILIIGWYGTETAGDKAALGEIIHQVAANHASCRLALASLYPYVSRWTLRELAHPEIEVVPVYSKDFLERAAAADEVIMAGGPLMHLEVLGVVLQAFLRAKRAGHGTRLAGCGIGPLDQGQRYEDAVRQILLLADVIELRDSASADWARRMTGRSDIVASGDLAGGFVRRWMQEHPASEPGPYLNTYLRDWTSEYQGQLTPAEFEVTKARFEDQLGRWIHALCTTLSLQPRLLAMHHFCVGNDDRDFNRRFAQAHLADLDPITELVPYSVSDILTSMQSATLCLCMRFHSVLFAQTLGVPFFAIDYTHAGKVAAYLRDHDRLDRMVSLEQVAGGQWRGTLAAVEGVSTKAGVSGSSG